MAKHAGSWLLLVPVPRSLRPTLTCGRVHSTLFREAGTSPRWIRFVLRQRLNSRQITFARGSLIRCVGELVLRARIACLPVSMGQAQPQATTVVLAHVDATRRSRLPPFRLRRCKSDGPERRGVIARRDSLDRDGASGRNEHPDARGGSDGRRVARLSACC